MPSEIVVNASGVDPDSLNWLMRAKDGHYFIRQQRNRLGSFSHNWPVSDAFATKVIAADMRNAWGMMEKHVAESI